MSTLNALRRRALAAVLTLCVCLCLIAPARGADVKAALDQVSEGAPVVIVVPSLSGLSQKISMLNDAMGLNLPALGDALGMFKTRFNMANGVRDDGSLVVVLTSLEGMRDPGQGPPPVVMLIPVTDYAAFIGNTQGADANAAIAEITGPDGQPAFARKLEGYALVGPDRAQVENFKPANKGADLLAGGGKLGGQYLTGADAAVYFNLAAMEPVIGPALRDELEKAKAEAARQDAANGGPDPALTQAALSMYNDMMTMVLRDTSAGVVAIDINELGIGLTGSAQFKKDSQLAGFFKNGAAAGDKLNQLPNQPFIAASAMNFEGLALKPLLDSIIGRLPEAQQNSGFAQMMKAALPLFERTKSTASAYYVPAQPGLVGGIFNQLNVIETTDAKGYVQAFQDQIKALNALKLEAPANPAAPAPEAGPDGQPVAPEAITVTSNYVPNAVQVDGLNVDQFSIQYQLPPGMMQQMGPAGPMFMMLGGSAQSGYIVAADEKTVITTSTLSPDLVRQGLAGLKEGKGLGTQQTIAQVRKQLSPSPSMEMYISVSGLMDVANPLMGMAGAPPIQVPQNLPPVGASLSVQEGGVAERLFVPTPVVRFINDTIVPMLQQMGGGGMGVQPGPRGGEPAPF